MAMGTTTASSPPAQQHPAPAGVGIQGSAPVPPAPPPLEPVLLEDIDPVLLVRLYPESKDAADMRARALAAGKATHEAGAKVVASQQEPVLGAPEPPHEAPKKA